IGLLYTLRWLLCFCPQATRRALPAGSGEHEDIHKPAVPALCGLATIMYLTVQKFTSLYVLYCFLILYPESATEQLRHDHRAHNLSTTLSTGGPRVAMTPRIVRVAVPVPLYALYDYRTHADPPQPGTRVVVPFGRREHVAVIVATDVEPLVA